MPIVPEGSKVLVTGANGFIAMWVIKTLLEQGFHVRGTVRSVEKGRRLREYFGSYGDKVEWVVVEDITKVCLDANFKIAILACAVTDIL
jgi:nucleoside-diphosphate-sugar epimerase